MRLAVVAATTALLASTGIAVAQAESSSTPTLPSDPGFCGVREGVDPGVDLTVIYTVRNKCNSAILVRVFLPDVRRAATPDCQIIRPHQLGHYTDKYADREWRVENC